MLANKTIVLGITGSIETPDIFCYKEFTTGATGDWIGNRPAAVQNASIESDAGGVIRVLWDYEQGATEATLFGLWYGTSKDVDTAIGGIDGVMAARQGSAISYEFTLVDGTAYWVAIVALSAGFIQSEIVEVGPCLADSTAPADPTILTSQTF